MKHLLTVLGGFLLFASAAIFAAAAKAEVVEVVYPFADACGPEITQYCTNIDYDLADCMVSHETFLSPDCLSVVEIFDRDRWGWDDHVRERWHAMGPDERADFRERHRDEMIRRRSGGIHPHHRF